MPAAIVAAASQVESALKRHHHFVLWASVIVVYMVGLLFALAYVHWRKPLPPAPIGSEWHPPNPNTIPEGLAGRQIRLGRQIFFDTPEYAAKYTGGELRCSDCHIDGGIAPDALPVVGAPDRYPMYSERSGRKISLKERIQECFIRSENGTPPPDDSPEMNALIAYMQWLSRPQSGHVQFVGGQLVTLPALKPDPQRGARIYADQCAGCHGENGEGGMQMAPPLWGPDSFNRGAGMDHPDEMARFVQHNMPQNRRGILSAQDAYDVSAYVHSKPRPEMDPAFEKY